MLKLLDSFEGEDNYTVWYRIHICLSGIGTLLQGSDLEDAFKAFCRRLFNGIMKRLGWDGEPSESHVWKMLRSVVISRLVWCGDEEVLKEARRRFTLHTSNTQQISPDLRTSVYRAALLSGDAHNFETLLKVSTSVLYALCPVLNMKSRR